MGDFYVKFNGVMLDDYLQVLQGFNRGIGTERTNNSVKVANKRGRVYLDHTNDQGVIPMPFILRYDLIDKRRELAKILNVSEPAPLIFGDEPDKIYYAVPTGDINVDETNFLGKGTITWEVPDGVAYAIEEKVINNNPHDPINYPSAGRNFMLNSINSLLLNPNNGNLSPIKVVNNGSSSTVYTTKEGTTLSTFPGNFIPTDQFKTNTEYTYSVDVYYPQSIEVGMNPYNFDFTKIPANKWTRIHYSTTPNNNGLFGLYAKSSVPDGLSYRNYKVSEGGPTPDNITWTPAPEDPKVITSDFKGKISGNTVGNPNIFKGVAYHTLQPPNGIFGEHSQGFLDLIKQLGGSSTNLSTMTSGYYQQHLISWNILEIVARKFPELKGITVDDLKKIVKILFPKLWVKGSSPKGNKVIANAWGWGAWQGGESYVNQTAEIKLIEYQKLTSVSNYIDSAGSLHMIVYADSSNGTIASSVSIDYASIEIEIQLPKSKRLVLINEGTDSAYPVFEVTSKGDNGLVALVSKDGIVQYGNPNEVDGVTVQKSTRPLNEEFNQLSGWAINPAGFNSHVANSAVSGQFVADGTLKVSDYGTGPAWHGPLIKKDIAGLPTNFSFQTWVGFNYEDVSRFGMIRLGVWDDQGKLIAELSLIKNQSNNFVLPILRVGDVSQTYPDHVADNFKDFYGMLQIDKFQDVIKFKVQKSGERYQFIKSFNTALKGQKVKSVTIWMCQYGNTLPASPLVTLTDMWAHNANVWEDVPNKFSSSDTIVLDHEKGKIYKNGLLDMLDADYGSKYFSIPPGETEVQLVLSDFAEVDTFKATYRERYL